MSTTSSTAGTYVCLLVCFLTVGAAVVASLHAGRSRRRAQDAQAAASWQALMAAAQAWHGAHMCHVLRVYQRAGRGTKAVIIWTETGWQQDAWFWYFWPAPGSTLLVVGAVGFGPHNRNPAVFYVEDGGVLAAAPPGAQAAWQRRQAAGHTLGK